MESFLRVHSKIRETGAVSVEAKWESTGKALKSLLQGSAPPVGILVPKQIQRFWRQTSEPRMDVEVYAVYTLTG